MNLSAELFSLAGLFQKLSSIRSKTFDWEYFQNLNDPEEVFEYASENLEEVDEPGTSRGVFIFSSKWVLKVALPENLAAGIAQNTNELNFALDPNLAGLAANVSDHHPANLWIKSELVRPVNDLDELLKLLELEDPQDMMYFFGKFPKVRKTKKVSNIVERVSKLVRSGVLGYDIMKSDSWGVTTSGRPVLLDYGMSPKTFDDFYRKKK